MTVWLTFIIAGVITYLTRASFIALGDRYELPDVVERALKYVGPAAFAAISVPLVLNARDITSDDLVTAVDYVPRVAAATAAVGAVWLKRNIALSLAVGMGTLWLLSWLF